MTKKKLLIPVALCLTVLIAAHLLLRYRSYNVVFITIDTQRPDYLTCYNPKAPSTPNIDHIAKKGVMFTNAFSLIPITMPSHTAMFTSRQPHHVKVFNNGDRFQHDVPMFTDLLEERGYTTGAFVSLGVLGRTFGLAQGFDVYEDNFEDTNGRSYKIASEINAVALPWIEKNHGHKFFAWLHYSDPHEPYIPHDAPPETEILIDGVSAAKICLAKKEKTVLSFTAKPGENRIEFVAILGGKPSQALQPRRFIDKNIYVSPADGIELNFGEDWKQLKLKTGADVRYFTGRATLIVLNKNAAPKPIDLRISGGVWEDRATVVRSYYGSEVQFVDKNIGLLWNKLEQLNLLNKTIVIITADHGEGLKTHGILGHVDKLWNETMHIPFIIYYPYMGRSGKAEKQLVNTLDIMPTILDLLHVRNKKTMEGQSLRRFVSRSPLDWLMAPRVKRRWTFASTYRPEAVLNSYSITDGRMKIINTPDRQARQWEAYDLVNDPVEKKNLARVDPKRFHSLSGWKKVLEAYRQEAQAAHERREAPVLNPDEEEMLQALGYVTGGNENEP